MTEAELAKHYALNLEDKPRLALALELWHLGTYGHYTALRGLDQVEQQYQRLEQITQQLQDSDHSDLKPLLNRAKPVASNMLSFSQNLAECYLNDVEDTRRGDMESSLISYGDRLLDRILAGEFGVSELIDEVMVNGWLQGPIPPEVLHRFISDLRDWFFRTQEQAGKQGFDIALSEQFPRLIWQYLRQNYRPRSNAEMLREQLEQFDTL